MIKEDPISSFGVFILICLSPIRNVDSLITFIYCKLYSPHVVLIKLSCDMLCHNIDKEFNIYYIAFILRDPLIILN